MNSCIYAVLIFFHLIHSANCSQKRQYVSPVKIDQWSGPFFDEQRQKLEFQKLVSGDTSGNKRTELGFDPNQILNPIPEKPQRRVVQDEGPVAETYVGKDPDAEKEVTVSPQERLAHLISKPIIHEDNIFNQAAKREQKQDGERNQHYNGYKREEGSFHGKEFKKQSDTKRYMFQNNEKDNDVEDVERKPAEEKNMFRSNNLSDDDDDQFGDNRQSEDSNENDDTQESGKIRELLNPGDNDEQYDGHINFDHGENTHDDNNENSKRFKISTIKKKTGKKSELEGIGLGNHVPEAMMPGGIPDENPAEMSIGHAQNTGLTGNVLDSAMEKVPLAPSGEPVDDTAVFHKITEGDTTCNDPLNSVNEDGQVKEEVNLETLLVHHHEDKKTDNVAQNEKQLKVRSHNKKNIAKVVTSKRSKHPTKTIRSRRSTQSTKNTKYNLHKIIPVRTRVRINKNVKKALPDDGKTKKKRWSHSTEHQHGFLEDNLSDELDMRLEGGMGHHAHVMTIGQHDNSDFHKEWNNMHSPGNGYYVGSGIGPARSMEGEYIHHNSHYEEPFHGEHGGGMHEFGGGFMRGHMSGGGFVGGHMGGGFMGGHGGGGHGEEYSMGHPETLESHAHFAGNHDPLNSLADSNSNSDHETAGLIDAIWEHDYDDGTVGRGHHHGKEGMMSFFGHSSGVLLPTETLDGFENHWGHGTSHGGHYGGGGVGSMHEGGHGNKIGAIQDIQDDPMIDSELQTMGIGMEMDGHYHTHHASTHAHHGNGMGYMDGHEIGQYQHHIHGDEEFGSNGGGGGIEGGFGANGPELPVDVPHHPEMSPEEYHNHIDSLISRYHQLEMDMKGQHGNLMDHLDEHLLHHNGHPHYHSGYDVYAYKNPWDNARLPYHVPVENHPDGTEAKPEVGGGSMEQGGKDDGKGEEKGGPLVEAKEESKPPPPKKEEKKKEDKEDKKPPEIHKYPDWTGMPPKVPSQRGGPVQSGSIGLNQQTELAPSPTSVAATSGSAPLLQAISAYKAMNLSVPANLQIKALQEQLKEAQMKAEGSALNPSVASPYKSVTPSADKSLAPSVASPDKIVPSEPNHESADAKTKEPENQADTPNGAAEVTKKIQEMGNNAATYNPQAVPQFQKLQQLNFAQQNLLKEMLLNPAAAEKPGKTPEHEDKEQTSVENILNLGHEKDNTVKQTQLLQILQNMQQKGAQDASFQMLANAGQLTSNFVSQAPLSVNAAVETPDSKSTGTTSEVLNSVVSKLMSQQQAKTKPDNLLKEEKAASVVVLSDETPSLDVPDDKQNSVKVNGDSDLVNLLTSAAFGKHKHKHHKEKHNTESPYAKIGYVASVDGTKKDTSAGLEVTRNGDVITGSAAASINEAEITPGNEVASDNQSVNSLGPVETSLFSNEDQDETSKKNKIKETKKVTKP